MQKTINSGKSQLTIDTQGGKIVELVIDSTKILGSFPRIDGKVGATHICTPNFAGEGMEEFGIPFHGPARNMQWEVVNESEKMIEIKVTLEALEKYKSSLEVRQIFSFSNVMVSQPNHDIVPPVPFDELRVNSIQAQGDNSVRHLDSNERSESGGEIPCFSHEVHVKNIGSVAMPVNIGIHNYFHTPNGWKEAKINNKSIKEEIENNLSVPVIARKASDEAISRTTSRHPCASEDQTTDLSDSGVASLPRMTNGESTSISHLEFGTGHSLNLSTIGAADFVTWTGVKEGKYDDKYMCIEPVCWFDPSFFGKDSSLLHPGQTRTLKQQIRMF